MKEALDNWCVLALLSGLKPVIRFVATLKKYKYWIVTFGDCPIHASKLEGTNNKIEQFKGWAYGYYDIIYFKLKIHQTFPGLRPTSLKKNQVLWLYFSDLKIMKLRGIYPSVKYY